MISLRLILLLLVTNAVTVCQIVNQCKEKNCTCCKNNTCSNEGYCDKGCKPEFPGCIVANLKDDQCGVSNCICCATSNCNISNGQCFGGCKPGYHGNRCRNKCPENCITCTDHPDVGLKPDLSGIGYCIECKKGHYLTSELYQCQSTCSSAYCQSVNQCKDNNCKCCAGDLCSAKGYCTIGCKTAFPKCIVVSVIDEQCGKPDCKCCASNRCDASGGFCSDGCKSGYHGGRCRNKCPENCVSCLDHKNADLFGIGNCTECKDGFFVTGDLYQCQSTCSSGCKSCTSKSQCTSCIDGHISDLQNPGSCILCGTVCLSCHNNGCSLCKKGYFITLLQDYFYCDKCPDGCLSCESNSSCTTCVDGRYGTRCENICPIGCKTPCTKDNSSCECKDEFTGYKCDTCSAGRYGTNCSEMCSENCKNNKCNISSGYCFDCESKFGNYCSFKCPSNCSNSVCDRHSGDCFACTFNQTYGQNCSSNCPQNCLKGTCYQDNGHCDIGCKTGFSGEKCEDCESGRYGSNCENNCSSHCMDQICNTSNGHCKLCVNMNYLMPKCENCTVGLFGENCSMNCSENCKYSLCNKLTGKCSSGCVGNFSGETCKDCIIGKFGMECTYDCPKRCLNNICMVTSGKCENCNANFDGDTCDECLDGFYGVGCDKTCPPYCWENICDQHTGNCTNGCSDGFSGDKCCLNNSFCDKCLTLDVCDICVEWKYGQTCEIDCPSNCKNSSCNKVNGTCYGCNDGFIGSFCSDATFQTSNKDHKDIAAPVVGTLLGLTIICITVVISVLYYRRRYTRLKETSPRNGKEDKRIYENANISVQQGRPSTDANSTLNLQREQTQSTRIEALHIPLSEMRSSKSEDLDESDYYKIPVTSRTKIQVSSFAEYIKGLTSELFIKEFQTLPKGLLKPCTDARKPENLPKNRYNMIYPYDDDRVKLVPPGSDFINACYIDGFKKKREYIASLGPIIKATENFMTFWRMVWQEKTEKIVMVTNLLEKGGMKCEQYWPDVSSTKSYGDVMVTCHREETFAEYTLRHFTVFKGNEERPLTHIHYTAWPDKAVPDDVTSLIDFRQKVNSIKTVANGRMIVHCSAGVGRTGTYIALDILTQEGETEGAVDVFGRVSRMRHQRTNMVQTWEQYEYLHHALVHTLTFDYRPIAIEEFEEYVSTCSDAVMVANFKRLQSVTENIPESETNARQRNNTLHHLNRKNADIPGDISRPRLYEGRTEADNDYINAVYLNSYRQKDRYILAMTPLPETVPDFLTLLIQEKVTCVVSLDDERSQHQGEHLVKGTYCPEDNHTLEIGSFVVKGYRVNCNSSYSHRSLVVQMDTLTGTKSQTLHHFQINNWPEGSRVPPDDAKFLQLIADAERATNDTDEKGTMVVHCLNAAERSCLFCSISVMLQKMDSDHEVSVDNTLRQVRVRRAMAFPFKEQYVFCHKCICTHLQSEKSNVLTNLPMRR